jgi:hypothetical protein
MLITSYTGSEYTFTGYTGSDAHLPVQKVANIHLHKI